MNEASGRKVREVGGREGAGEKACRHTRESEKETGGETYRFTVGGSVRSCGWMGRIQKSVRERERQRLRLRFKENKK